MTSLDTIGTNSTISQEDKEWLIRLSNILYESESYTKAIYLDALVAQAKTTKEI